MKAIRITGRGGPEVLALAEVADPTPGPTEVLVRVRAAALNRADLLQCMGLYPAPPDVPADIPGLEYAGEVEAVGSRVRGLSAGARVMGIIGGGALAERLVVHERELVPVPAGMSLTDAAAIPEAFFTAFDALVLQGGLRSGEAVLIHAAGSGVGTAAIQLVRALGATPIATARSEEKLSLCKERLGLSHGVVCAEEPPAFAGRVKELTHGRGADLALELTGGAYFPETVKALGPLGRLLLVGLLAGPMAEVNLGHLLLKRLRVFGTTLRGRPLEEKIAVAQAFARSVLPLFASGQLRPVVDSVVDAAQTRGALERMAQNRSFGKIVVEWR